jgi:hypothetical protein
MASVFSMLLVDSPIPHLVQIKSGTKVTSSFSTVTVTDDTISLPIR